MWNPQKDARSQHAPRKRYQFQEDAPPPPLDTRLVRVVLDISEEL